MQVLVSLDKKIYDQLENSPNPAECWHHYALYQVGLFLSHLNPSFTMPAMNYQHKELDIPGVGEFLGLVISEDLPEVTCIIAHHECLAEFVNNGVTEWVEDTGKNKMLQSLLTIFGANLYFEGKYCNIITGINKGGLPGGLVFYQATKTLSSRPALH